MTTSVKMTTSMKMTMSDCRLDIGTFGVTCGSPYSVGSLPDETSDREKVITKSGQVGDQEFPRAVPEPFDLAFVNAMIPHHLCALMMAEMASQLAIHPELLTLAEEMFTTQENEIDRMRGWRTSWYGPAATPVS